MAETGLNQLGLGGGTAASGASGAPDDAQYLVLAADADLANETVVSSYPFAAADIATDAIDSAEIAAGAVDTSELATGAVTTTEILDGTLTQSDWSTEEFQDEVGSMAGTDLTYNDSTGQLNYTGSTSGDAWSQVTATSDFNASDNESVWGDGSTQAVDITLPSPAQSAQVRAVAIDTTNAVTVSQNSSEGINDTSGSQASLTLSDGESVTLESNGTTWWVV